MKNKIQFQKGYSLVALMRDYGTEEQCRAAPFQSRWPQGYVCSQCGGSSYCTLRTRALYQCNYCHHQHSLISGTIFEATKLPLTTWFLAIHLLTQAKTGLSDLFDFSDWLRIMGNQVLFYEGAVEISRLGRWVSLLSRQASYCGSIHPGDYRFMWMIAEAW